MAFACERVERHPGGPVSFHSVLDGIAADDFPAPSGTWFAIFCFYSAEEKTIGNCRVVVAFEGGDVIAQSALKDLKFTARDPISRNVVRFQGLSWPYPGRYSVTFMANRDDTLASFPMWVQHAPPAEPAQEPSS